MKATAKDGLAPRLTTDKRIEQILVVLHDEQLHTSALAERLSLSAPRTRQLVELMLKNGQLSVAEWQTLGKGRPKRLLQVA